MTPTPPSAVWLQALRHEFAQPAYDWRQPGGAPTPPGWLRRALDALGQRIAHFLAPLGHWLAGVIGRFLRWLTQHASSSSANRAGAAHPQTWWLWLLLAALAAAIAGFVWDRGRRRRRPPSAVATPVPTPAELERATGAEYSSEHWLSLCLDLQRAGDFRLALRAAFLACLAVLQHDHWLHLRRDRTNREYVAEFRRRLAQRLPDAAAATRAQGFDLLVRAFDRAWYGGGDVSADDLVGFLALQHQVTE